MHSIEISEAYVLDKTKSSGFMAEAAKKVLGVDTHEFHLGTIAPNVMNKIGGDIDFAIIDTVHALPGEILDFLVILPFLKLNAVVCLHDVSRHKIPPPYKMAFATASLLCSVDADKIVSLMPEPNNWNFRYPNIGAFQLTPGTRQNIINVFLSLVLPWNYVPKPAQLRSYSEAIHRTYEPEIYRFFDDIVRMNSNVR